MQNQATAVNPKEQRSEEGIGASQRPGSGATDANSRAAEGGARKENARAALRVSSAFFRRPPHPHFTFDQEPPEPRAEAQSLCEEERSLRAAMLKTGVWSARQRVSERCAGRGAASLGSGAGGARGGRAGGSTRRQ